MRGRLCSTAVSLLILPPARTSLRRSAIQLAEELHFDPRAARRAVAAWERDANRAPLRGLLVRSDLPGLNAADVRRALSGLPSPGDYRVVIKPLRYRTRPHLAGLCEVDVGRSIVSVSEPFQPFAELVYVNARRKPGAVMKFAWLFDKRRFRSLAHLLRFVHHNEWLQW